MRNRLLSLRPFFTLAAIVLSIIVLGFVIWLVLTPEAAQAYPYLRESVAAVSTAAMVVATLILAYATFSIINSDRQREANNRKERYLTNEIIVWLKELEDRIFDSSKRIISRELIEDITTVSKSGISLETWLSLTDLDQSLAQLNSLASEIREGEYTEKLASKLDRDLGSLVNVVLSQLKQRRQLILDSSQRLRAIPDIRTVRDRIEKESELIHKLIEDDTTSLESLTLSKESLATVRLGRNAGVVRKSILNAIGKAVEIKMRLLQA